VVTFWQRFRAELLELGQENRTLAHLPSENNQPSVLANGIKEWFFRLLAQKRG